MNQQVDAEALKTAFEQAEKAISQVPLLEPVKAAAKQNLTAQQEFYAKAAAMAQKSGNAAMEIIDTNWATNKMLSKKLLENVTANTEAAFDAAQRAAQAKSLAELARIQSEYLQTATDQARKQTEDFFDLWSRAAENAVQQAQKMMAKSSN